MDPAAKYSFKIPWAALIVGVPIFLLAPAFGLIRLSRDYVGVFRLIFLLAGGALTALGVILVIRRAFVERYLELSDSAVIFPSGFLCSRSNPVPYAAIVRIHEVVDRSRLLLHLGTSKGEFDIWSHYLPDLKSYGQIRKLICQKTSILLPHPDVEKEAEGTFTGGFPEPLLRWVEPDEWPRYHSYLARSVPLSRRIANVLRFFISCSAIILLPWLLLKAVGAPTMSTSEYLTLATVVSAFFTWLNWLSKVWPVSAFETSVRDTGVTLVFGRQYFDLTFNALTGWAILERSFEGVPLHVVVFLRGTRQYPRALRDSATRDKLVQILKQKNVPETTELTVAW